MFLSKPIISGPGEACTETYVVAGRWGTKEEAGNYASYLRTRFCRFLVSLRKATQDAPRGVYGFVPDLPMDRAWTDSELFDRYGITPVEREYIEGIVADMAA
jgi:site-specific DNA-methyltransferase (adenine-specific)